VTKELKLQPLKALIASQQQAPDQGFGYASMSFRSRGELSQAMAAMKT